MGTVGRHQLLHDTVSGEHIFAAESWCAWAFVCWSCPNSCDLGRAAERMEAAPTSGHPRTALCAFRDHVLQLNS